VDNDKVYFRDARVIWGIADSLVVGRIIAEKEKGRGMRTVMRIGGAGVKLVRYACVTTETYRHFGRLGLGAVFGSKNLRALVVIGRGAFKVRDMKAYKDKLSDEEIIAVIAYMKSFWPKDKYEKQIMLSYK